MPITSTANRGLPVRCFALKSTWLVKTARKGPPVSVQLEQDKSSRNGKPGKESKSESSDDDSDHENDGEKWKEEREFFIAAAAAKEAFLQEQVDKLQQELVMEKVNSASSLSSGSNASKCIAALKPVSYTHLTLPTILRV